MNKIIIIVVLIIGLSFNGKSQKVLGTGTNSDVVAALQPIQLALKELLMKKSMDYKLYQSMDESQKSLKAVYEASETLSKMKVAFEIVDLIKSYACIIKQLDLTIASPNTVIPYNIENNINNASCLFEFEYQNVLSGFTLCLDIIETVVTDVQMSLDQRLNLLHDVHSKMQKVAALTIKLQNQLKYG